MNDIENKVGLIFAGLVIFIFLMVVAFIKRNNLAKTDEIDKPKFPGDHIKPPEIQGDHSEQGRESQK